MSLKKGISRHFHLVNALSNWGAMGIEAILALFLTPFVINYLGKEGYGIWVLIASIIGYYGFLDLGVGNALMRYVSRYSAQGKKKFVGETVSTALMIFFISGSFIVVCSYFSAFFVSDLVGITGDRVESFVRAIRLLGVAMAVRLIGNVFRVTLLAREMFVVSNIIIILTNILRAGITLMLLIYGFDLLGVAISHLVTSIIFCILYFISCRIFIPDIQISFSVINKNMCYNLLAFGGVTVIIAVTDTIRFNLDSLVIAKVDSVTSVGIYGIAAILVRYFTQLVISAMGVLVPRFAALSTSNNKNDLTNTFLRSLFVCSLLSFSLAAILLSCGGNFILLWVGDEFKYSVHIMYWLVAGHLVAVSQHVGIGMMYGLKKHHWYALTSTVEAFFNLVLSVLLGLKYGILGVALGTVIPMVVIRGFFQPYYVSKILNIPVKLYVSYWIPGAALGGGTVALIGFVWNVFSPLDTYYMLAIQSILSLSSSGFLLLIVINYTRYFKQIGFWQT